MDVFWDMETSWPEFMKHDPIGNGYYASLEEFTEYVLVCLDETGRMVAKAHSVPFRLDGDELPDAGWDAAIRSGLLTRLWGEEPNACSAVEIAIEPGLQGTGLSGRDRRRSARQRRPARLHRARSRRCGPTARRTSHEPMADVRLPHPRRRAAGRPVAARPRPRRRPHRPGRGTLDGHPRHGRGVAGVDRAALRPDRPGAGARGARAGDVRRRARHRGLRRAQRLGTAPDRRRDRDSGAGDGVAHLVARRARGRQRTQHVGVSLLGHSTGVWSLSSSDAPTRCAHADRRVVWRDQEHASPDV